MNEHLDPVLDEAARIADTFVSMSHLPLRAESHVASAYRLVKRNGELVLQGAYHWREGGRSGFAWRDIPTVVEA